MMAVFSPKMSVTVYQSSWRHNPQDRSWNHTRHENTQIFTLLQMLLTGQSGLYKQFYHNGRHHSTDDNLST